MHSRSVATHRTSALATPAHRDRQRATAEIFTHLVMALAVGSGLLLLVSAGLVGVPFLPGSREGVHAIEAWSLIRTSATVQIAVAVLATGLAALAKAGGATGPRAERWCVVAALSAAAGTLLLVVPPV